MGKRQEVERLYQEMLSMLDELHTSIGELAGFAGIADDRGPELSDRTRKLPRAQFVVDGDDEPERNGLAFDTHLALCMTVEQGDLLLLAIARALRQARIEHDDKSDEPVEQAEFELELTGRVMLKPGATREICGVFREQEDEK